MQRAVGESREKNVIAIVFHVSKTSGHIFPDDVTNEFGEFVSGQAKANLHSAVQSLYSVHCPNGNKERP